LAKIWLGQTAVKLSGAEATDRAQYAAPDKPIGYWNLLLVFANLKRVIQCTVIAAIFIFMLQYSGGSD